MTITEALQEYVATQAERLETPAFFDGEPFIAPEGPYLRCSIGGLTEKAAGIGKFTPVRVDGRMELTLESLAGAGSENLSCQAAKVAAIFPYGFGLECETPQGNGEIVFAAPQTGEPEADSGRVRIKLNIGFYAILFPEEKQQCQK